MRLPSRQVSLVVIFFVALAIVNLAVFFLGKNQGTQREKINQNRAIIASIQQTQDRILVLIKQAEEAHTALCTFRGQLKDNADTQEKQVRNSRGILKKNPLGFPSLGLSYAEAKKLVDIQQVQVDRTRATIQSLSDLKCRPKR